MNNRQEQIDQARRLIATGISEDLAMVLYQQFPELKESEDERIRKALIKQFSAISMETWAGIPKIDIISYLEKQKEQQPAEWSEEDEKMQADVLDSLLAFEDLILYNSFSTSVEHIQKEISWLKSLPERFNLQPKQEWSEEDRHAIENCEYAIKEAFKDEQNPHRIGTLDWLKSLRLQPKEEREPMEIKYGGKIYQVHGVRALPGGATGYIIEDEPGHYDCIINPEEVLGCGYGVKQNGSPYPTKEATFDYPHWKPSEEQMETLKYVCTQSSHPNQKVIPVLESIYNDLKKLM